MNIKKELKKELKEINRRKKECAKKYPDWRNDEFNMLEDKFIWGICLENPNIKTSFATWNDAMIYFNRESELYYLHIDSGIYTKNADFNPEVARKEIDRLEEIKKAFRIFMIENDIPLFSSIQRFADSEIQYSFIASNLSDLYTRFYIVLEGYKKYREEQFNKPQH